MGSHEATKQELWLGDTPPAAGGRATDAEVSQQRAETAGEVLGGEADGEEGGREAEDAKLGGQAPNRQPWSRKEDEFISRMVGRCILSVTCRYSNTVVVVVELYCCTDCRVRRSGAGKILGR